MAQRNLGSAKRTPQLEKIKKSVKKVGTAIVKRIAAAAISKTTRARSEVKGRSKARRAITRKSVAKRSVKAVARRKSPRARK
jgi:hypothetical protein